MAIYQYYLEVIPKSGILKKHHEIPKKIDVDTSNGFFESNTELFWKELKTKAENIIPKMDLIINRANWSDNKTSYSWKFYHENVDNDASIYLKEKSLTIHKFYFRSDLRESNLTFLKKMITLGIENEWIFMNRNGKLLNPVFEEIIMSIKNSDAYNFLDNPNKFLEELDLK